MFVRCVSVCLCVCARAADRSNRPVKMGVNANSSKTVKATDFKFDTRIYRDSSYITPKNFSKSGVARVT